MKWLTLHGGHVEEVAGDETPAGSLFFRKSADWGNLCGEEWEKNQHLTVRSGETTLINSYEQVNNQRGTG